MSDLDLDRFKTRLLQMQEELNTQSVLAAGNSGVVELDQSRVGRLSRMDALQAQAMSLESGRRREVSKRRITAALRRIDAGEYGDCLKCDEPIDRRRLEFDPSGPYCLQCADNAEM
jgi:DnaK suppressor protein